MSSFTTGLSMSIVIFITALNGIDNECNQLDIIIDANQCRNERFTNSANCFGYNSCFGATINTESPVECQGASACSKSPKISTNNHATSITCGGYQSCSDTQSIITDNGDIFCLSQESCINSQLIQTGSPNNYVSCQGPDTCSNSRIDTENLECSSKASCQNCDISYSLAGNTKTLPNGQEITYQNSVATCSGSHSCQSSDIKGRTMFCYGRESCSHTKIQTIALKAYGILSLYKSEINAQHVDGSGYKSLIDSIIDTNSRPKVSVNAYGYSAGKGATFICRSGAECILNCRGNGCKDMSFVCESGADCKITPSQCQEKMGKVSVIIDGISCPNYTNPGYEDSNLVLKAEHERMEAIEDDIDGGKRCQDSYSCVGEVIDNGYKDAIFSGYYACEECDISFKGDIDCIGFGSCYNSTIKGNGVQVISCLSDKSCAESKVISTKFDIECMGVNGCQNVELLQSKQGIIDCSATSSCKHSQIEAKQGVNCDGLKSCQNSEILLTGTESNGYIKCSSQYSCIGAKLTNEYSQIVCSSDKSCHDTIIEGEEVVAMGNNDLFGALVTAKRINGFGYQSLSDSIIDSGDLEEMTIFAFGHETGKNGRIICRNGAECKLECKSDGCLDLDFECRPGSICSVSPSECKMDNSVESIDNVYCPNWNMHRSKDLDHQYMSIAVITVIVMMQLFGIWIYKTCHHTKQLHYDDEQTPLLEKI